MIYYVCTPHVGKIKCKYACKITVDMQQKNKNNSQKDKIVEKLYFFFKSAFITEDLLLASTLKSTFQIQWSVKDVAGHFSNVIIDHYDQTTNNQGLDQTIIE